MGDCKEYRWDRRRLKRKRQTDSKAFHSLWGFELILLILIFAIWLIGAKFVLMYAIITSPCVEAAAFPGPSVKSKSVFDLFFEISVVMGVFWTFVTIAFWRTLWKSKTALFHLSLLFSILLLAANFRFMHIDDNLPPDGKLAIGKTVIDRSTGEPRYAQWFAYGDQYGDWYLGRSNQVDHIHYSRTDERCVWLDRNLISDGDYFEIDGYVDASIDERIRLTGSRIKSYPAWERPSLSKQVQLLWVGITHEDTFYEMLKNQQKYRPLSDEERARFLAKQECLKDNAFSPTQTNDCRYYWGVDMEAEYMSWLNEE